MLHGVEDERHRKLVGAEQPSPELPLLDATHADGVDACDPVPDLGEAVALLNRNGDAAR